MGQDTKIQWAHHTFNPWRGCTKVAEGCKNCYADRQSKRNPGTLGIWGPNGTRVVAAEKAWREPLKWDQAAAAAGEQHRVFCASLADVFEDWRDEQGELPLYNSRGEVVYFDGHTWTASLRGDSSRRMATMSDVRRRLFELIDATPNLDWLLVTKRPENILRMWPKRFTCEDCHRSQVYHGEGIACGCHCNDCGSVTATERRPNVWLLTSVACQEDADRNIPELLKCRDLVPVLGVSAEPLIGPVSFRWGTWAPLRDADHLDGLRMLDWVITGGESGPNARPCDIEWIYSIVEQCRTANVACFVKQLGAKPINHLGEQLVFDDKKGGDFEVFPSSLRVREFPEVAR